MSKNDPISPTDARVLGILQKDGRRSYADLGAELGMAGPSAHERVKKLESRGVIRGYRAVVDPNAVGLGVLAFTWVTQAPGTISKDLTPAFLDIPEIEECHYIAGEADYILKIRARDMEHLGDVVRRIQTTEFVFSTETDVVFSTGFEGRPLALARDATASAETDRRRSTSEMAERRAGGPEDAALVRAVAAGSEDALAALYDRHVDGVHAVALRLTNDRQLAEEVVQETFLALWNRAELFDPAVASLGTWLRTIARNRTVDRLRAAGRRPSLVPLPGVGEDGMDEGGFDRLGPDAVVLGAAAVDPGPEAAAEAADVRAAVGAALAAMPEAERTVIVLAYREGLTQREIAERLDWPLGTVKTRTRRALAHLRDALEAGSAPVGTGGAPRDGW
ncbi:MAG TPA: sigma-70 family RNA polymerase sigma factor [Candidatus Limnocylindrales bacterium]|nr:sigma-70 family RNA polymerase sigma factor [Candidatus Limnocylindrales bacterium]